MDYNDTAIVDRIQRDHFSHNFVPRDITRKMEEFRRTYIQPFFETRLLLSEIQSLVSDPDRSKILSDQEKQYIESILYQPSLSCKEQQQQQQQPPHRRYAEQVFGLTEDGLKVPPMQIKSKLSNQVDLALQEKYKEIHQLASIYQEPNDDSNSIHRRGAIGTDDDRDDDDIDQVVHMIQVKQQELTRMRIQLPAKRASLNKLVTRFVKITLEVLDTVWSIIREFKCDYEQTRNASFDAYYCALTDTLLLRIKILHVSTLLATYDTELVAALQSLRTILENRYLDARTQLSFAEKKLKAYQEMGPEFETLADAYFKLLEEIKATEDDIHRIKNN